jgi:hypothetical protein
VYDHLIAIFQIAVNQSSKAHFTPSRRQEDSDDEDRLARSETRSTASSTGTSSNVVVIEEELMERVTEVKRIVEGLSLEGGGEEGEAEMRAMWAMLSFALDDWK